jgi:hypothetical protein
LLTRRGARETEWRALRSASAADMAQPLRECRILIRRHGRTDPTTAEVARALESWADAFDRNGHRLPDQWQHMGRSVRAAVGTVFGPVTFVDIRPDASTESVETPDFLWQDFADDYLGYLLDALMRWGDLAESGKRTVHQFDRVAPGNRPARLALNRSNRN